MFLQQEIRGDAVPPRMNLLNFLGPNEPLGPLGAEVQLPRRLAAAPRPPKTKAETEAEYLAEWAKGEAPWTRTITTGHNGAPQSEAQIPYYRWSRLECFKPDSTVDPTSLPQHVLRPREKAPRPAVPFKVVTIKLREFLETKFPTAPVVYGFSSGRVGAEYTVGSFVHFEEGQDVRYHGTHPCSMDSIMRDGIKAVRCNRKGVERVKFEERLFSTKYYNSAVSWSQFVDVGHMLGFGQPVGWFCNAVFVVEDHYQCNFNSDYDVKPMAVIVSLRNEQEVYNLNGFISPYFGGRWLVPERKRDRLAMPFIPAVRFEGHRPGYAFKSGPQGYGYY